MEGDGDGDGIRKGEVVVDDAGSDACGSRKIVKVRVNTYMFVPIHTPISNIPMAPP